MTDLPVVVIVHRRPRETQQVFDAIRRVRPRRLLVIADGAREEADREAVAATRAVFDAVDWDCRVERIFATENLGLRRRIESGLDEAFSLVDRAVILEDDCVPHEHFFRFCRELLDRYADDDAVTMVSGDDAHGYFRRGESWYFSRFTLIWGWATWASAWSRYDKGMSRWPAMRDSHYLTWLFRSAKAVDYWTRVMEENSQGGNSWARVWMLTNWLHEGRVPVASRNLVSNVGFDERATHTRGRNPIRSFAPTHPLEFPLEPPARDGYDDDADRLIDRVVFSRDPHFLRDTHAGGEAAETIVFHDVLRGLGVPVDERLALVRALASSPALRARHHLRTPENAAGFVAAAGRGDVRLEPDLPVDADRLLSIGAG